MTSNLFLILIQTMADRHGMSLVRTEKLGDCIFQEVALHQTGIIGHHGEYRKFLYNTIEELTNGRTDGEEIRVG
jgi:hypothetical protein